MADQTTVDLIERLIQLATHIPTGDQTGATPEERRTAALKACQLIAKFSVPLGAEVKIVRDAEWHPPSPDFMSTVEDILKGAGVTGSHEEKLHAEPGLMIQDTEVVTREEAFRQQMKRAWQAIREERKRIESIAHNLRVKSHVNIWDEENPKPWQ